MEKKYDGLVKTWFTIIVSIIAIVSATIAFGEYITFGPLARKQENQEARIRLLELQYAKAISEIKINQRNILDRLNKMD